jgi:hypothetical protein
MSDDLLGPNKRLTGSNTRGNRELKRSDPHRSTGVMQWVMVGSTRPVITLVLAVDPASHRHVGGMLFEIGVQVRPANPECCRPPLKYRTG